MSNVMSFTGKLGRDAEVRHLSSGGAVLNFTVATNTGYGDNEKTLWLQCSVFGKRAEGLLVQYLKKGVGVFISGELSENEYKGTDGIDKKSLRVTVNTIDLTDKKSTVADEPKRMYQPSQQDRAAGRSNTPTDDGFYSQIPF
jgi:single-strand DNA-binding protein